MREIDKKLFEVIKQVKQGKEDEVAELLAFGADPNAKNKQGGTPLHMAVVLSGVDIVNLLIQYGADVNAKNSSGDTPLHKVFFSADIVRILVNNGADVNAQNNHGETPLHRATVYYEFHPWIVKTLIDLGADVNLADNSGGTPLHYATYLDKLGAMQMYLQNGADVNACDRDTKSTPLYLANSVDGARVLIANGADVNCRNVDGLTPLHWVANPEIAELLIKSGADINAQNSDGVTPLRMAKEREKVAVQAILQKYGAIE